MATYGHEGGYAFNEDQRGGHTDPMLPEREWVTRVAALLAPYLCSGALDHALAAYPDHGRTLPDDFAADEIDALGSMGEG